MKHEHPVKIGNVIDGVIAGLKAENARRKKEWAEKGKAKSTGKTNGN